MSAVESAQPLTALALLAGDGESFPGGIAHPSLPVEVVGYFDGLERLPEVTRQAAAREVRDAAAGLLDVSLIDILVAGWRAHHDLTAAARRTLTAPGSTELVHLARHEIAMGKHPSVSLLVDGQCVATFQLDFSAVLDITALLARVCGGRLVALHSGRCDVIATLAVDGINALAKQAHLELPGVIPLGPGIWLLGPDTTERASNRRTARATTSVQGMARAGADASGMPAIPIT